MTVELECRRKRQTRHTGTASTPDAGGCNVGDGDGSDDDCRYSVAGGSGDRSNSGGACSIVSGSASNINSGRAMGVPKRGWQRRCDARGSAIDGVAIKGSRDHGDVSDGNITPTAAAECSSRIRFCRCAAAPAVAVPCKAYSAVACRGTVPCYALPVTSHPPFGAAAARWVLL